MDFIESKRRGVIILDTYTDEQALRESCTEWQERELAITDSIATLALSNEPSMPSSLKNDVLSYREQLRRYNDHPDFPHNEKPERGFRVEADFRF